MVDFVQSGAMAKALGVTRQTVGTWVRAGKLPGSVGEVGEWRRWPVAIAVEILTARGCPVPAEWTAAVEARAA